MTQDCIIGDIASHGCAPSHGEIETDTVIVGNGPAALFLSFLLHGNVPYYDPVTYGPHPDPILHRKLLQLELSVPLYDALQSPKDVERLTEHFEASPMSYSNQAQRINVLLDTLLRPSGDVDIGIPEPRVRWVKEPWAKIDHVVLGSAPSPGGQWSENPAATRSDIQTLSYADMLSLPGYTFFDHYREVYEKDMPPFTRPTRRDVSSYYAAYPSKAGILSSIGCGTYIYQIERVGPIEKSRFIVRALDNTEPQPMSYTITCKHIVLASGIFTRVLSPPEHLQLLREPSNFDLSNKSEIAKQPLLVVGSGFTAADVILSAHPSQKILHVFKWDPSRSPLKGCHPQAYPEYARIYRQMKLAASQPLHQFASYLTEENQPAYEGFPNAEVISTLPHPTILDLFIVRISLSPDVVISREVSRLAYFVGRRGDLTYLSPGLQAEIGLTQATVLSVSGDTLRAKVAKDVQISKGVFAIGSLTGDSLVKFGFGSGVYSVGKILRDRTERMDECGISVDGSKALDGMNDEHKIGTAETPSSIPSLGFTPNTDEDTPGSPTGEVRRRKSSDAHKQPFEKSPCSSRASSKCSLSSAYAASKDSCIIS